MKSATMPKTIDGGRGHEERRRTPAAPLDNAARIGRKTSCPVAFAADSAPSDQAAPLVEPAGRDDGGKDHRRDAGAGADEACPRAA